MSQNLKRESAENRLLQEMERMEQILRQQSERRVIEPVTRDSMVPIIDFSRLSSAQAAQYTK